MLLFKPYHVFPIVTTDFYVWKTETRRDWKTQRAKVGSIHQCKLRMFTPKDDYFAKIKIIDVYEQPLGEMTEEAALREGGYSLAEYARLWQIINKKPLNPLEEVWVVEMKCVEVNLDMAAVARYGSMYRMHMAALRGSV